MIATALVELQSNRNLWLEMVDRGRRRVALFDWRDTAVLLRAHYRELAGERLEPDEELLLKKPPLV